MKENYIAAVVGGACAGSEAAWQLAKAGVEVVVFEQKALPFGKIEDGIPRWHTRMREREYGNIEGKIDRSRVSYVPHCRMDEHFTVQDLLDWGFSLVILANGAWKDRPLPAKGIDKVSDYSFAYQNSFAHWFNHCHECDYCGPIYPVTEGAAIIGGGWASIDMVKICQLLVTRQRLREIGLDVDIETLEHKGIDRFLRQNDLCWQDIKLAPATLFYRRTIADMPLVPSPSDPTREQLTKLEKNRCMVMENMRKKYCFQVRELCIPSEIISENGSVTGLIVQKTRIKHDKAVGDERECFSTRLVISSIGSVPKPVSGIEMSGELYDVDLDTGRFRNFDNVFGVGNAITGRGNIQDSLRHSSIISQFLAKCLNKDANWQKSIKQAQMREISEYFSRITPLTAKAQKSIFERVKAMQKQRGYQNYRQWKEKVLKNCP